MTEHIKINKVSPRIQYVGDGTKKTFEFTFAIFKSSNLTVYIDDELIETTAYTVTGANSSTGGSVTFTKAPANGKVITLCRNLTIERTTDFQEGSTLRASVLNSELDYQTACLQEVAENLNRSLILSPYVRGADPQLILPPPEAGKTILWDAECKNLVNSAVRIDEVEAMTKGYKDAAESSATAANVSAVTAAEKAVEAGEKAAEAGVKAAEASASAAKFPSISAGDAGKIPVVNLNENGFEYQTVLSNPMTATGDIIVGGTTGAAMRLPKGANNTYLGVTKTGELKYNNCYTRFCINEGLVDMKTGTPACFVQSGNDVTLKAPVVMTNASGNTYELTTDKTLLGSVVQELGIYNVFASIEDGGLYALKNTTYRQAKEPIFNKSLPSFSSESEALSGKNGVKITSGADAYAIIGLKTKLSNGVAITAQKSVVIDLGGLKTLKKLLYLHAGVDGSTYPAALLSVRGSQDNTTWTTLYTGTNETSSLDMSISSLVKYRYVEFTIGTWQSYHGGYAGLINVEYEEKATIGDVWLDTSLNPSEAKQLTASGWVTFDDVPVGIIEATPSQGPEVLGLRLTVIHTFSYNYDGFNLNTSQDSIHSITEKLTPDWNTAISLGRINQSYTPSVPGMIIFIEIAHNSGGGQYSVTNEMGMSICRCSLDYGNRATTYVPVCANEKYTLTFNNISDGGVYFVAYKGV